MEAIAHLVGTIFAVFVIKPKPLRVETGGALLNVHLRVTTHVLHPAAVCFMTIHNVGFRFLKNLCSSLLHAFLCPGMVSFQCREPFCELPKTNGCDQDGDQHSNETPNFDFAHIVSFPAPSPTVSPYWQTEQLRMP